MARMLQFAGYCYGPIFQAGLNFWQSNNGNFWGHNAIIRTAPFIEHCALPAMPGSKHSRFMSHDYVEAALMRKANYEVWLGLHPRRLVREPARSSTAPSATAAGAAAASSTAGC